MARSPINDMHKDRYELVTGDEDFLERRLDRARSVSQQPWGPFLVGIVIRVVVVFAIAASVITVVQYLHR